MYQPSSRCVFIRNAEIIEHDSDILEVHHYDMQAIHYPDRIPEGYRELIRAKRFRYNGPDGWKTVYIGIDEDLASAIGITIEAWEELQGRYEKALDRGEEYFAAVEGLLSLPWYKRLASVFVGLRRFL